MLVKTIDGTPDAVKVACPVWDRGKDGDNFKVLPIVIACGDTRGQSSKRFGKSQENAKTVCRLF